MKNTKYKIGAIGACVRDMFIVAQSQIITKGILKNKQEFLAYPYGAKIPISEVYYDFGGEAGNVSVAMAKLNLSVRFAGVIGNSRFYDLAKSTFEDYGINTKFLYRGKEQTKGFSLVLLGPNRDRTILTFREQNNYKKINIKKFLTGLHGIYIGGVNAALADEADKIAKQCRGKEIDIFLNPSNYQLQEKNKKSLMNLVSISKILCVNFEEAITLTGRKLDVRQLLRVLHSYGAQIVIITLGKKGAYCFDGMNMYYSGILPFKRLDSTGSGDAFFSTFVAIYVKQKDIALALRYASLNSSYVISQYGAQVGLQTLATLSRDKNLKKVIIRKGV